MEFERFEEFLAIAEHGSIKKAAPELGISSATLSARLIRFEEFVGTPLFERTGDAMALIDIIGDIPHLQLWLECCRVDVDIGAVFEVHRKRIRIL